MHTTFCDEVFVERLLKLGADPRADDSFALVNFASRGRLRAMEALLARGANPNARFVHSLSLHPQDKGNDLLTPPLCRDGEALSSAVTKGHEAVVHSLLKNGALPSEGNALVCALQENRLDLLKLLLESGADANKGVPLKKAIAMRSVPGCLMLIRADASIGRFIGDLIRVGVEGESVELLELLHARQVDMSAIRDDQLAKAVGMGSLEVATFFLGLSPTSPGNAEQLLRTCCSAGHLLLLELFCSVASVSYRPLLVDLLVVAVREGHLEIVRCLQSLGGDLNAGDCSLLALAAGEGNINIVQYLIEQGATPHAGEGAALKKSSQSGNLAIVKILLEYPADPKITTEAMVLARKFGNQEIMVYFRTKGFVLKEKEKEKDPEERKSSSFFGLGWLQSWSSSPKEQPAPGSSSQLSPDEVRQARFLHLQAMQIEQQEHNTRQQEEQQRQQRESQIQQQKSQSGFQHSPGERWI